MRLNRLVASLMGLAGACVVGVPAKAAQLQSWQFDASQNRLTFKTDSSVQPRARLLSNPNRLVVELPGIGFDQAKANQVVGGVVQAVRVEQADSQTTRMVLELSPDYSLTSRQIQVWGITSQQWVVQLPEASEQPGTALTSLPPTLKPATAAKPIIPPVPVKGPSIQLPQFSAGEDGEELSSPEAKQVTTAYVLPAATQLQNVVTTPNGFFIQTAGATPQVQVYRVRDRNQSRQLVVDVLNAQVTSNLQPEGLPRNQYGVNAWSLTQFQTSPPAVRIILALEEGAPEWQVTPIRQGGIVLLPLGIGSDSSISPTIQRGVPPTQSPRPVTLPTLNTPPPQNPPTVRPSAPVPTPATLPPVGTPLPQVQPVLNQPIPRGQAVVVLDPGHGGADPGAVGIGGLQEKLVVTAVTQQVAAVLRSQGIAVLLTRQGDEEVDLQPRVEIAENANATLFVSIHANAISMDRPEVNGVETYYYSDMGERFAQVLHSRVISMSGMTDRGTRQARFFVLRRTSMPAVLVETGYVTGAIDAPKLRDPNWQAQMGNAIAAGILDYLRQGY
ncbi:MAG TPA: N-acetylmuramoyl-L-alanine amidase [Leptolyngbyaceae cyanobacterium]